MRSHWLAWIGLVGAACGGGGDDSATVEPTDAGSSSSSSSGSVPEPVDSAPPEPPFNGFPVRVLKASKEVNVIGITTGATPHVVYYWNTSGDEFDLEAVPVAGGAPVVLQKKIAAADFGYVSGGAVGWFTSTDPQGVADAINIWTPATGIKTVTTLARDGFFVADPAGVRVAFGTDATEDSFSIAVTTAAAPNAANPALTGENEVNVPASQDRCPFTVEFAGDIFIGAYCTGVDPMRTQPRLVTVDAAGTAVVRVDDAVPANDFFPDFRADATGTKILVTTPTLEGRVILTSGATTTIGSLGVFSGSVVTRDGFVVYTQAGVLKRATFSATPEVTTLLPGVTTARLQAVVQGKAIYGTQQSGELTNLNILDTTSPTPVPTVLVASPTALFRGWTGDDTNVVFFTDVVQDVGALKSIPFAGGAPIVLDPASRAAITFQSGSSVLSLVSVTGDGSGLRRFTYRHSDASKGGPLADAVRFVTRGDLGTLSGKTFIITDEEAGLIAVDVP